MKGNTIQYIRGI